jgi:hypothetical protein
MTSWSCMPVWSHPAQPLLWCHPMLGWYSSQWFLHRTQHKMETRCHWRHAECLLCSNAMDARMMIECVTMYTCDSLLTTWSHDYWSRCAHTHYSIHPCPRKQHPHCGETLDDMCLKCLIML